MKKSMKLQSGLQLVIRFGLLAVFVTLSAGRGPLAHADTMLKAATTMVVGTAADTYSIDAPSSGTLTVRVSNTPWPVPLSALSFSVTTLPPTC